MATMHTNPSSRAFKSMSMCVRVLVVAFAFAGTATATVARTAQTHQGGGVQVLRRETRSDFIGYHAEGDGICEFYFPTLPYLGG